MNHKLVVPLMRAMQYDGATSAREFEEFLSGTWYSVGNQWYGEIYLIRVGDDYNETVGKIHLDYWLVTNGDVVELLSHDEFSRRYRVV